MTYAAITFGSVCSGIEAASVAWHSLGWRAAWLAEIEPFPCAVLAHHYPDVPNMGDMTTIARRVLTGEVPAPDVFCGGTPCQAFSVAGLRDSLDDARGNLTLKFVEIADAIDHVRVRRGEDECIVFWENVPGVLNTKDNAFGCFLGGLAGEDGPLVPPGDKWANAGAVYGPRRAIAWRTLDAQYFGVAQRRRRVFVVASARNGFDPAQVLFEWDGVRRDSAPRREARQTAPTIPSRSTAGGGLGTDFDCDGGVIVSQVCPTLRAGGNQTGGDRPPGTDVDTADSLIVTMAHGQGGAEIGFDRGPCLTCNHEAPIAVIPATTHTLRGEGFDASEDGTGRGTPLVPVATAIRTANTSANGHGISPELAHTLDRAQGQCVAFDTTQIASATNRSNPQPGDACHPLAAGAHAPAIAFPANLSGTQCASAEDLAPAMMAKNPTAVAHAIQAGALRVNPASGPDGVGVQADHAYTLEARAEVQAVQIAMQVRRLTPTECERLQGFPDGYTAIPWRKKPASECPDGPRYKALGNSWAVPNARWIGQRITQALDTRRAA